MQVLLFWVVFGLAAEASAAPQQLKEKILLPLGESAVTLTEKNRLRRMLKLDLAPPSTLLEILSPDFKKEESLIQFLAAEKLIDMSIKKGGTPAHIPYDVIQKEAKKAAPGMLRRIQKNCCRKKSGILKRKLQQAGMTLKTFKEKILQSLQRDIFLSRNFTAKINISNSSIQARLSPAERRTLGFEYDFDSVSFERNSKGIQEARDFLKRARSGKSGFQKEAQKNSQIRLSLKNRKLKTGEMSAALEKAVGKLSVSKISPLIPIGQKIYIFHLNWKTALFPPQAEKRRQELYALLLKQELRSHFLQWFKDQKSDYSLPSR